MEKLKKKAEKEKAEKEKSDEVFAFSFTCLISALCDV